MKNTTEEAHRGPKTSLSQECTPQEGEEFTPSKEESLGWERPREMEAWDTGGAGPL